MANSADSDQLASSANWSGSTLFEKAGYIRFQQDKGYTIFFSFLMDIHIIFFLCLLGEVLLMSTHNICNCMHPPIIMSWADNSVKH